MNLLYLCILLLTSSSLISGQTDNAVGRLMYRIDTLEITVRDQYDDLSDQVRHAVYLIYNRTVAFGNNVPVASCSAASRDSPCEQAYDHDLGTLYYQESTQNDWIQFNFEGVVNLTTVYFVQDQNGRNRDIQLEFSDSSSNTVTLPRRQSGLYLDRFEIPPVLTKSVRVTVLSEYKGLPVDGIKAWAEINFFT